MFSARLPKNIKISTSEKASKALISGLIFNVKYRSFRVMLAGIECA
jgi:hypothetical protein